MNDLTDLLEATWRIAAQVERGNPADAPQLAPAVGRVIRRTRRRPRTVTADRGYGEARVDDELHELGSER